MQLATPKRSTEQFTWIAAESLFVAEASDLGEFIGRVYDDACDVGFTLVSHRTGSEIVFALASEERDREGDLLWEDFTPVARDCHYRVRVFND